MSQLDLRPLLEPDRVAVIGASATPGRPGYTLTKNILDGGYPGQVFPVNPRGQEILGLRSYASVSDVPVPPDLAFIVLGRERVRHAVSECGEAGVRAVCIITAGFGEGDAWGVAEQELITEIVAEHKMVAIGPNTIGTVSMGGAFVGSFVPFPRWETGPVAVVAQTGIYAGATALENMTASAQRIGMAVSVDIGNRVGIDELDLLQHLAQREETSVLGFYLEELVDPRGFLRHAAEVKRRKPVIVLKSGRTREGARASASHTGSLAADDEVLDQLFAQHGVVRAADEREFLDLLKAFSYAPVPDGGNVGVVTYSGALGVVAVDQLMDHGLTLADLSEGTGDNLSELIPDWQRFGNPADLWSAVERDPARAALDGFAAMLTDPGVDQVLGVLLAVPPADFPGFRDVFAQLRSEHAAKPVHLFMTGALRHRWTEQLEGLGIPVYESTRQAAAAISAMARYGERREWVPSAHSG